MEVLPRKSTETVVVRVVREDEVTWMTPILEYLRNGTCPSDKSQARKLRLKAARYVVQDGILYKRGYLQSLLRCIGPKQGEYVLKEMHEGSYGAHVGSRMLAKKVLLWGYY